MGLQGPAPDPGRRGSVEGYGADVGQSKYQLIEVGRRGIADGGVQASRPGGMGDHVPQAYARALQGVQTIKIWHGREVASDDSTDQVPKGVAGMGVVLRGLQ